MRYKFIILFLFISFVSKAQVYQLMPQYGYSTYRMNFDSTIQIPTFCGVPKLGSNKINKGALAFDSCNNRFYFFNPKLQAWDTIKSGSTVDTTKFVRYTDTSAMLLPYLRKIDTTNRFVSSVTKLNDSTIQVIKGTTTSNITISSVTSATRLITQVWNNTGATILRGSVVYISGRHSSNLPTIALAEGNNEANSYKTFALVDGDIPDNSSGFVIQAGKILGLNLPTSSYTDGDILYLSPTVAGGYTITKPLAPNHIVKLGSVTRAHPTQGSIEIKIENGWQLDELSDVQIASVPADSVLLQFSRVDSLWHDVSPTTAMGNRFIKPADTSAMLSPYLRSIDTTNKYVTSVFRKTASDSVFFVRGGSNNFAFRDSAGGTNIYNTDGTLTGNRTVTQGSNSISFTGAGNKVFNGGELVIHDAAQTSFRNQIRLGALSQSSTPYISINTGTGTLSKFFMFQNTPGFIMNAPDANPSAPNNKALTLFANATTYQNDGLTIYDRSATNANSFGIDFASFNQSYNIGITSRISTSLGNDGTTNFPFLRFFTAGSFANGGTSVLSEAMRITHNQNVLIGTTTDVASSILTATSTTKGFLQPRLTTTQMNAISTPATGLSVFNTTDSLPYVYRGTSSGWQKNVIYTRTNDIGLLNGADQRLMIEPTTNVTAGRSLTVEAGSTQALGGNTFTGLGQTSRQWRGICVAPNGDVYATVLNGDIYRQASGAGNFVALSQTSRQWQGIAAAPNGDIYAVVNNGDIYKRTGGTGNFIALGQTSRAWYGITVTSDGSIYASVNGGDIYKSTDGGSTFTALGQTSRSYQDMHSVGLDVYVAVFNGNIFKQTGGTGSFVSLGGSVRFYRGITSFGVDFYATTSAGDVFKQTGGTGTFDFYSTVTNNQSIAASSSAIYVTTNNGDIFTQSTGTANLNGGTLVLQSGVGKGTGTSTINFNTGTTLASGATLQTASTKMTILGNGNVGIGTTSPSAKLELSDTARGFLQTRMTTTQRNNIASPSVGLQVFTTTDSSQYVYRGTGAGWQQLANEIVNTASLNFPSTNAQNSSDLTITLTGAVDGDAVVLGVPNAAVNANSCYTAWVSAANTVTVRFNNYSSGAIDPAQATFRVTIIK